MKLALVVVGFMATTARADDASELVDALAARDTAKVATFVHGAVATRDLWFDDAKCARFANATVKTDELSALVRCLAALRIHDETGTLVYEPGVRVTLDVTAGVWTGISAVHETTANARTPEISAGILEAHRTAGTSDVVPDTAALAAAQPGQTFGADLDFCVGGDGGVSLARVASTNHDAFGATVVAWTKAWRFRPVVVRDHPVAVCARETIKYTVPVPHGGKAFAQNIAPTALESMRVAGDKRVPASAEVKRAQGDRRLIASYKICVDEQGSVTGVSSLKSSGIDAYDHQLEEAMRGWRYRPFLIRGVATAVCTAVTFIEAR